jgi:hypothetical protein
VAISGLILGGATLFAANSLGASSGDVKQLADRPTQRIYVSTPTLSLQTLAQVSTEVALVRVESERAEFPERGIATTVYTASLLSSLKGSRDASVEFEVAGARNETQWVVLEDAPHFEEGEEVLLFLWTSPSDGKTGVLGLGQGTYRVSRRADGRRRVTGHHADGQDLNEFLRRVAVESGRGSAGNAKEVK